MRPVLGGLTLASPIITASGCGGTGRELAAYADLPRLGAFVTRTVTLDAPAAEPVSRLAESPSGLVHASGLHHRGLEHFLATELPTLLQLGARVVISIGGANLGEYAEIARRLGVAPGVSAVEINLSAPDPEGAGLLPAHEPFQAGAVVAAVQRELPPGVDCWAKLRLDPLRAVEATRVVAEAGASAVVLGNALPAALPDGTLGGLSGPAILPLALRCVRDVHRALPEVPLIGCGGVTTVTDARAYLAAGALAVQVGAALLHDPTTAPRLIDELTDDQETP